MKKTLLQLILLFIFIQGSAQENDFTPSGKGFATIFANYHQGLNAATTDESAFELVRGYLGYEYTLSPNFYARVTLDIGSPDDLSIYAKARRYAYFKNAFLRYTRDKLEVEFGLISLRQFKLSESVWERRYLMKSLADEYSLNSSADLGMNINYEFTDNWSADLTIMNGEGYNNVQTDGIFQYSIGSTLAWPKSLTTRLYYDFTYNELLQSTWYLFVSYDFGKKANLAWEGVYRNNERWRENNQRYGYSVFAKYNLDKQFQLFARYDQMASNKLEGAQNPWNLAKDGSALVAGIQYRPISKVKIALNYHDWVPLASNTDNKAFLFLNLEVKM